MTRLDVDNLLFSTHLQSCTITGFEKETKYTNPYIISFEKVAKSDFKTLGTTKVKTKVSTV